MTLGTFASNATTVLRGGRPPFALCYHGVGPVGPGGDPHRLMAPAELFVHHLDVIAERGHRLLTLSELWAAVRSPEGGAGFGAITIDDGLAATAETVARLVGQRDASATLYIPTGLLGQPHPHLPGGERIVDRSQLVDLAEAGLEIGAHSVDHPDLRLLAYADVLDQMRRSRHTLEDLLGRPVRTMAYPFGSFDSTTMAAAEEAGYETACTISGTGRWMPYALPREPVYPTTTSTRLRLKLAGMYGPATAVARVRNRVRRPPGRITLAEDRRVVPRVSP